MTLLELGTDGRQGVQASVLWCIARRTRREAFRGVLWFMIPFRTEGVIDYLSHGRLDERNDRCKVVFENTTYAYAIMKDC